MWPAFRSSFCGVVFKHAVISQLYVVSIFMQASCAVNCMDKYLKMTQRISQRFQEYQMQQTDMSILAKQGSAGISG